MKKYILFFVSIGLLLTAVLIYSTISAEQEKQVSFSESGYILNSSTDRYYFYQDETYSTSFTRIAEAGSILFSVRAPVGRLNITKNKIVIGRGIAALNHKSRLQSFLFYMLKERFFKDNLVGNGSIFASISKEELLNQQFIIPCEDIMVQYDKAAQNIDDRIATLDRQTELLTQARDRLLPKLMSGEVEV